MAIMLLIMLKLVLLFYYLHKSGQSISLLQTAIILLIMLGCPRVKIEKNYRRRVKYEVTCMVAAPSGVRESRLRAIIFVIFLFCFLCIVLLYPQMNWISITVHDFRFTFSTPHTEFAATPRRYSSRAASCASISRATCAFSAASACLRRASKLALLTNFSTLKILNWSEDASAWRHALPRRSC